jgi:predicted signal transduction protein with EAL and GGDEF domain
LGQSLGLTVIAEGIETTEQVARLQDFGCKFVQGGYFSDALEANDTADLLAKRFGRVISPETGHKERSALVSDSKSRASSTALCKNMHLRHKDLEVQTE